MTEVMPERGGEAVRGTAGGGGEGGRRGSWLRDTAWPKAKLWVVLYLLVLPVAGSLVVFSYYPKADVVVMSFFRWEPPMVQEFVGLKNFEDAFADPQFWQSFRLVGLLLLANLVKMWPAIFAAIALHRLASDRLRYVFQVLFVVPMIIPAIVGLLVWKSFYDPDFGLLNKFLNATGLMGVLHWLDGVMPAMARGLEPFFEGVMGPVCGGPFGLAWIGGVVWWMALWRLEGAREREGWAAVAGNAALMAVVAGTGLMGGTVVGALAGLAAVGAGWAWLARVLGRSWIVWPFLLLGGVLVFGERLWLMPVWTVGALGFQAVVRRRTDGYFAPTVVGWTGAGLLTVASLLTLLGKVWVTQTGQFAEGNPAWLGNQDLVIPALLFWGFPWVGTVGVLIYLSGLQNIPADVYEAAALDGVSPWKMMFLIELPLIMTQVRINLIFMTIGTLTGYEMFLLLLGPDGGPGNKGMVPGLYIFSSAFSEGRFGYGCALGMVLFVIILVLTVIYQKYVKVDK